MKKLILILIVGCLLLGTVAAYTPSATVMNAKTTSYTKATAADSTGVEAGKVNQEKLTNNQVDSQREKTVEKNTAKQPETISHQTDVVSTAKVYAVSNNINPPGKKVCKGDINLDGKVNSLDIDPFVALMGTIQKNTDSMSSQLKIWLGDFDDNGIIDSKDINPFVQMLVGDRKLVCKII